jgi:hypothetical protein
MHVTDALSQTSPASKQRTALTAHRSPSPGPRVQVRLLGSHGYAGAHPNEPSVHAAPSRPMRSHMPLAPQ